jgi:hypothetical protein
MFNCGGFIEHQERRVSKIEITYSGRMQWHDAVSFLLTVAKAGEPKKLSEGDRLNLIEGLRRFLEIEGPCDVATQLEEARSNPNILRPVIEVVGQLADAAADHRRVKIQLGPTSLAVVFDGTRLDGDRVAAFSDGKLCDVVADVAAGDFGMAEPWQIGRCRWRECGNLFLANRKGQVFCSHGCANTASSEAYKERKKAKIWRTKAKRGGN